MRNLKSKFNFFANIAAMVALMGLFACSTTPKVKDFPSSSNAKDEVQRLESDLASAEKEQVKILSPSAFEEASQFYRKASENDSQGRESKETLNFVAQSRAKLELAQMQSEEARKNLGEVISARNAAMAAGSATAVEKEFQSIEIRLESTTAKLEKNNTSGLKEQKQRLTADYKAIELAATKANLDKEKQKSLRDDGVIAAQNKSVEAMAAERVNLKEEQEFNKSFEAARAEFSKDDAEVYRQGNQLVIRLRSLEFPANQSVIRGSNFPLLAKVAKVVNGFENSNVTIEGHTDSAGGKELNHNLSSARAQAVSSYLVSNQAVDQKNVTTVGYGYERPLATNKTSKGRAQNRRVDIVISPNKTILR